MEIRTNYMTVDVYNYLRDRYESNYRLTDHIGCVYANTMDAFIGQYVTTCGGAYVIHNGKIIDFISNAYDVLDLIDYTMDKNILYLVEYSDSIAVRSDECYSNEYVLKSYSAMTDSERASLKAYADWKVGKPSDFETIKEYTDYLIDELGFSVAMDIVTEWKNEQRKQAESMKQACIGDVIKCHGRTVIIRRLLDSYRYESGWFIEGYDQHDRYFVWKQNLDGGQYIKNQQI